ncbi:MAG TPA: choice-of-anchor P family protein, partial [Thermoanaerobaculia bacterium]|nr:choice-of-anchor P family protein [Thermoanaerobaculia bacterium]
MAKQLLNVLRASAASPLRTAVGAVLLALALVGGIRAISAPGLPGVGAPECDEATSTSFAFGKSAALTLVPLTGGRVEIATRPWPAAGGSSSSPFDFTKSESPAILTNGLTGRILRTGLSTVSAASDLSAGKGVRAAAATAALDLDFGGMLLQPLLALDAENVASTSSVEVSDGALEAKASVAITAGTFRGAAGSGAIPAYPAPNSVLLDANGVRVVLNEQIWSGDGAGFRSLTVNAIHVSLSNAVLAGIGTVSGDVIIAQSKAEICAGRAPRGPEERLFPVPAVVPPPSGPAAAVELLAAAQTPTYSVFFADAVTGDNAPQSFSACNVTCTNCFLPDSNPNVDSYTLDDYERPTGSGSGANAYFPALDIVATQAGSDADYFYFRIDMFGQDPGGSLPFRYAVALNYDGDARLDTFFLSEDPKGKVGTTFGNLGVYAWNDDNDNVGAARITFPDGPSNSLGGYENLVFDQGNNDGAGGSDAVQARIVEVAGVPKSIEFAVEREFLEGLNGGPIGAVSFCVYASKAGQTTSANTQLLHDEYSRRSGGSPYPWLTQDPGPIACPNTLAEEDALTPAQRAALDSGTSTPTAFCNPCYPSGGNIVEYDNVCSLIPVDNTPTPTPTETPTNTPTETPT